MANINAHISSPAALVDDFRARLADEVERFVAQHRTHSAPSIGQVSIVVPAIHPLRWLAAQPFSRRLFWKARDETPCMAGCGVADEASALGATSFQQIGKQLEQRLITAPESIRYFGGGRFDLAKRSSQHWRGFSGAQFMLPRFQLEQYKSENRLVCNVVLPEDSQRLGNLLDDIGRLRWPRKTFTAEVPTPVLRTNLPTEMVWQAGVQAALQRFKDSDLEKVVLARQVDFRFDEPLDACLLLHRLTESTVHAFHFLLDFGQGSTFIGATPERLFKRVGRQIQTEAVAGTRPRGHSAQDDASIGQELLSSEKDLREHAYVMDAIQAVVHRYCRNVKADEAPRLMELRNGRHLFAQMEGELTNGASDFDLLDALHPSPAVGGVPVDAAYDEITRLEPFDRGWYAGPVGWLGANGAEFAVGIRSALVRDDVLSLYSGAGIVRGSQPNLEWEEIEQKISNFLHVLELDLQRAKY